MKAAINFALFISTLYEYFWVDEEDQTPTERKAGPDFIKAGGGLFNSTQEKDRGLLGDYYDDEEPYSRFAANNMSNEQQRKEEESKE